MRTLLLALVMLSGSLAAHAEPIPCEDNETINHCLQKNIEAARGFPGAKTAAAATPGEINEGAKSLGAAAVNLLTKAAADASQPGSQSGTGNETTSTITDLIPWLNLLGVLSDSDTSDGTIAVDLNFLLPLMDKEKISHNSQFKWVIGVHPEPNGALVAAFAEDVRAARKATLQADLHTVADSELQFTWSFVNKDLGRDFRQHHDEMRALLAPTIASALRTRDAEARRAYLQEFGNFIDDPATAGLGANPGNLTFGDEKVAPFRKQLQDLMARSGAALGQGQKAVVDSLHAQLAARHLDVLPQLVLLQPQLLFSATHQFRDELVGPESWGTKITYERSRASFQDFINTAERSGKCRVASLLNADGTAAAADAAQPCYDALTQYVSDHASAIENEDRFSASLEYRKVDSVRYSFPSDGVALTIPKTDRMIGSLAYGRALPRNGTKDRVDFKADYDSNLSGKAGGKSRLVVSATYTREIFGVTVPFSVVYANKSEFLEGVDKQVSLHVGVKYKAPAPPN